MIKGKDNRVFVTAGEIFVNLKQLKTFLNKNPLTLYKTSLKRLVIIEDEATLLLQMDSYRLPFTMTGFKSLCAKLKVPANYINKLNSSELALYNINNNPNKTDSELNVYTRQFNGDERKFVCAVSDTDKFTYDECVEALEKTNFFAENELEIQQICLGNEDLSFYALSKELEVIQNIKFQQGLAIVTVEGVEGSFQIYPYYRVHLHDEDSFDFVWPKALKKISSKQKSFKVLVQDALYEFDKRTQNDLFDEVRKLMEATLKTSDINFSFLKLLKSSIGRAFAFQKDAYDTANVLLDVLPEYKFFNDEHKEKLRELPKFESNNITIPFYLPRFFSKFESQPLTNENPIFFNRQLRIVGKIMEKAAETYFA